jgi:hypothetical protein
MVEVKAACIYYVLLFYLRSCSHEGIKLIKHKFSSPIIDKYQNISLF